jgi:hypothetical protein
VDRSRWVRGRARSIRHARALGGRSPDTWRTALPGMGPGVHGVQLRVFVLHRPGRSRPRAEPEAGAIVAEVTRLAESGVREITLLGQNVNSWGRDLAPELSTEFGELLRAVTTYRASSGSASRARTRRTSATLSSRRLRNARACASTYICRRSRALRVC